MFGGPFKQKNFFECPLLLKAPKIYLIYFLTFHFKKSKYISFHHPLNKTKTLLQLTGHTSPLSTPPFQSHFFFTFTESSTSKNKYLSKPAQYYFIFFSLFKNIPTNTILLNGKYLNYLIEEN